jgi:RimJ/RimL family protein N-acetyltransferase
MERRVTQADLPIETARLTLRRFRISDAAAIFALYEDPEVVRYLYSEPMRPDDLGEALFRRLRLPKLESEGDVLELAAVLRSTGQMIGAMTIWHRSDAHERGEIGYTLLPRFTGFGFAQEGAVALLHIGFDLLGLHRLEAQCDARNLASARVMKRIGMRQEANFRENEFVKGEWTDALVYAMLAEEWAAQRGETGARALP